MELRTEKIKNLEEELSKTKYNKKSQHHIGLLKAKIARLKEKHARGSSSATSGYAIQKTGDATVVMLGFPSVGKSTLLNKLTNADSPVAPYPFTTLTVIPGLLEYKHAKIQILDIPGIIEGASEGRGRGREVLACIRAADMIIILIDVMHPEQKAIIEKEMYIANIRLNQNRPNVLIKKKNKGGIDIASLVKLVKIDNNTIKVIMHEFKMFNADVVFKEDVTIDQFIDVIEGGRIYLKAVTLLNKIDLVDNANEIKRNFNVDLCISAENGTGINEVKEMIFNRLGFMSIYCKRIGSKADLEEPLIMKKGQTLNDMCLQMHKDFVKKFKFARIWGKSVKFDGQKVIKLGHILAENDVVELHI